MKKLVNLLLIIIFVFCFVSCEWFSPTNTDESNSTFSSQIIPVNAITISPTNVALKVGDNQFITVTFDPQSATDKTITWSSSGLNVAIVDTNGIVTAVGLGGAVITAISNDGNKTAACIVTVSNL